MKKEEMNGHKEQLLWISKDSSFYLTTRLKALFWPRISSTPYLFLDPPQLGEESWMERDGHLKDMEIIC